METQERITKTKFRDDMKYIRAMMRLVEKNLTKNNWQEIYTICQEVAATATEMEYNAQNKNTEVK